MKNIVRTSCEPGFSLIEGMCISNDVKTYANVYIKGVAFATPNTIKSLIPQTDRTKAIGAHVCTKEEMIRACYTNPNLIYGIPAGYTMLLGDSCGDDCTLYVNQPWACTIEYQFNIDGVINSQSDGKWAYRLCY